VVDVTPWHLSSLRKMSQWVFILKENDSIEIGPAPIFKGVSQQLNAVARVATQLGRHHRPRQPVQVLEANGAVEDEGARAKHTVFVFKK